MVDYTGVRRTFFAPLCELNQSSWIEPKMQVWKKAIFLHSRSDGAPYILQILNLTAISNYKYKDVCIPIVDAYIEGYKTFIYTVKEDNILERWLITPDGEKTDYCCS